MFFRKKVANLSPVSDYKRHRIVHFIHLDGDGGGPYSVSKHITFYSHFHHVHVVHGGRGRIAETCEELGIPHTRVETDNLFDAICSLPILAVIFFNLRPDLLILHGQWAGPLGGIAGRLAFVSRILYIAHWPSFYTDWDIVRVVRNWMSEWIPCRLASCIIAISRANRVAYLQMFPWVGKKMRLLSNSVDAGEVPSEEEAKVVRTRHGWNPQKLHIVSIGRLVDQKRINWLLDAWDRCRDLWNQADLWIVGDGLERKNLEDQAQRLDLGASCQFLGSQPRGIVYVAAADIVVFTSLYEAFGNVTLEAMICGKPIVASRVAGIESTLEHGKQGFLVAPGSPDDLAGRIGELISDRSLREKMGASGKQRARKFMTPVVLPQFLSLVNSLLPNSK